MTAPILALDAVPLGRGCRVSLQRTLRVPDDGGDFPLPPSLGSLPVYAAPDGRYVAPLHAYEALWLSFEVRSGPPRALKVGLGSVDAVTGERFEAGRLSAAPQDYLVLPEQPWLDGINAGDGWVRQFVAVPLGTATSIEAQLHPEEPESGGLRLALFDPLPGRLEDVDRMPVLDAGDILCLQDCSSVGLGAGGRIRQEVFDDPFGVSTWQAAPAVTAEVDLVDADAFAALTGVAVPRVDLDAAGYTAAGGAWFELARPGGERLAATERLRQVRSVGELGLVDDAALPIPAGQVRRLLALGAAFREHERGAEALATRDHRDPGRT
jgi:hypothetical protein